MTCDLSKVIAARKAKLFIFFLLLDICLFIVYFNFKPYFIIWYYKYIKIQHLNVSQFVSFDESVLDGRRLGNQIFSLAAVIYVSQLTGRRPVLLNSSHLLLEDVFQLNFEHFDDICPCFQLYEGHHLSYEEDAEERVLKGYLLPQQSILVRGFRQSWKYTRAIGHLLRRHLVFKDEIRNAAEVFFESSVPSGWKRAGFVRVGVHVRRGDIMNPNGEAYGYTVPNGTYFERAMGYFVEKYGHVQFIVASDDLNWTREHIVTNRYSRDAVNVAYCSNNSAGQDLALLSMCDHVIMSTGSFGWWAAWLAKGTTIYYSDWPRKGSQLEGHFTREDFFPPNWIPMSD